MTDVPSEHPICRKCNSTDTEQTAASKDETAKKRKSKMEGEPLRYLAGYIAYRLKRSHPNLGNIVGPNFAPQTAPDWISMLSKGGLTAPSDSLMSVMVQLENGFEQFYGPTGLHACNNVVRKLQAHLLNLVDCKKTEVPEQAIELYSRLRTFIRTRRVGASATAAKVARQARRKVMKFVT